MNLDNEISQTMIIPLFSKALDAKKKDPFLNDWFSVEILEKLSLKNEKKEQLLKAKMSMAGCVARTWYIDKCVQDFIEKNDNVVVVNFGCGLDARSLRIANKKAIFYDSDFKDVMNIRNSILDDWGAEQREWDIFKFDYIDELKKHKNAKFIFVIEGVFMYCKTEDIDNFLFKIAKNFKGEAIFDIISPLASKYSKHHDAIKYEKAKFIGGYTKDEELLVAPNLEIAKKKFYGDKDFKKIFGFKRLIFYIPCFKNMSRIINLKIN